MRLTFVLSEVGPRRALIALDSRFASTGLEVFSHLFIPIVRPLLASLPSGDTVDRVARVGAPQRKEQLTISDLTVLSMLKPYRRPYVYAQ